MTEPEVVGVAPPGGPRPPAPPATGDPGRAPDPADPGPPITVCVGPMLLGDLGHPRVDAKILTVILLRNGPVGEWLRGRDVSPEHLDPPPVIRSPDTPLAPGVGQATASEIASYLRHDAQQSQALHRLVTDASQPVRREIAVWLDDLCVGDLGSSHADSRLVSAIAVRGGAITDWLSDRHVDEANVERAFPASSWT